jgi:hypothetical protein
MNFELFSHLQAKGEKVRATPLGHNYPLTGGCAVVVIDPKVWDSTIEPYSIAIVNGGLHPYGLGKGVSITFKYSAYKDKSCQVSGSPESIHTPVECLRFTGIEIEISFWKHRNGIRIANNAEGYKEYVPLFEYYQSEEAALVKRIPVDQSEYETCKKMQSINITNNSLFIERLQTENPNDICSAYQTEAFAVPELVTRTSETVVLTVYYREYYTIWDFDKYKYVQYKPDAYFKQDMLVYTPPFKAIGEIKEHLNGKDYHARLYYKHTPPVITCIYDACQNLERRLYPAVQVKRGSYPIVVQSEHPFLQALVDANLNLCIADNQWTIMAENTIILFFVYTDHIYIQHIATYSQRRKGHASALMQQFIAIANKTGTTLKLACIDRVGIPGFISNHPVYQYTSGTENEIPMKDMPKWFERFGFVITAPYQDLGYYMERQPISINK